MENNNNTYTYESVLGDFHRRVDNWVNDANRVPARKVPTKEEIKLYAGKVYMDYFKDSLHNSVLDKYNA